MGGPVVPYLNKYIIISINSTESIQARHLQFGYLPIIVDSRMHYAVAH